MSRSGVRGEMRANLCAGSHEGELAPAADFLRVLSVSLCPLPWALGLLSVQVLIGSGFAVAWCRLPCTHFTRIHAHEMQFWSLPCEPFMQASAPTYIVSLFWGGFVRIYTLCRKLCARSFGHFPRSASSLQAVVRCRFNIFRVAKDSGKPGHGHRRFEKPAHQRPSSLAYANANQPGPARPDRAKVQRSQQDVGCCCCCCCT